jgi:hypothetical protein
MVSIAENSPRRPAARSAFYTPSWNADAVAAAWENYAEPLLRKVAARAIKPRQKLPAAELREKLRHWHENPPQVDRRLRDLTPPARTLLALLHLGKRCQWRVGSLLELASCLQGDDGKAIDGLKVTEELFLHALIIPLTSKEQGKLGSFESWLAQGVENQYRVWIAPEVLTRAALYWDALPPFTESTDHTGTPHETDGLEWFLRLGALWQEVHDTPARLTQQGTFFKRDQDRLTEDALLNQPLDSHSTTLPQQGHFLVALALALDLLRTEDVNLRAGTFPDAWQDFPSSLTQVLGVLSEMTAWSIKDGWLGLQAGTNAWPTAMLVTLAVLLRLKEDQWTTPTALAPWIAQRHCFWSGLDHAPNLSTTMQALLLGMLVPLRLLQHRQTATGEHVVRLTPLGRAVLSERGAVTLPRFPKTLLVQPNLELVAYRQGLTPQLVAEVSKLATWKTLGAVCTLQIDQHSVHRGLEAGASFESAVHLLDHHGVHRPPGNVVEALRTWAAKRDRLAVYQGANLLEFFTKDDRDAALSRGLAGMPLADRYVLIEDADALDYRHFRTLGTRDYALPPAVCVGVTLDGVTLAVDAAKADLLLETELLRFAVPIAGKDNREFLITPQSLARARSQGLSLLFLEDWFTRRTGQPLSPAARLLWTDRNGQTSALANMLVFTVSSEDLADGLWQWPDTRPLLLDRLGPRAFAITTENVPKLREKLAEIELPHLFDQH